VSAVAAAPGPDTQAIAAVLGDREPEKPPASLAVRSLPLAAILVAQVAMSIPLLRSNTAFGDEALYLWSGHLEWAHWLHGARIPAFQTWFSGAPVLYPPIGAIADSIGGLLAARILSLGFMLGCTVLLWATAARLYGRRAALFAAGLFVMLGVTLHLSAFATYDPMALFLAALATWCVVKAPRTRKGDSARWIVGAALALALADATKYAVALFDPVVVAVAVLNAVPALGWRPAMRRGILLTGCIAGILLALLRLGGSWYEVGIGQTTTMRAGGSDTAAAVLLDSWRWTAPVVVLAAAALAIELVRRADMPAVLLILVLAGAALLAPVEQARIHTTVSLVKHVDFGAWFAAIAAGYALAMASGWVRARMARMAVTGLVAVAVVPLAAIGITQSRQFVNWPDSSRLMAAIRPLTDHGGRFLAETSDVPEYYLPATTWRQWSNTFSITLPSGIARYEHGSPEPYIQAIKHHYFSVVILDFTDTTRQDEVIAGYLRSDPSYRQVQVRRFPNQLQYYVWRYVPQRGR
jgi:4-amino-4-deoxy-L-arabinose transferase-like glycosyltransferase